MRRLYHVCEKVQDIEDGCLEFTRRMASMESKAPDPYSKVPSNSLSAAKTPVKTV